MNEATPPRDALRDFAVFAEELNFTRAAERLAMSQPSLHAKVAKLQAWAGVPLYEREGRALVLTQAGSKLASFGRAQASALASLVEEIRHGEDRRPVRLAAGEGALLYLLGSALRRFARRHPSLLSVEARGGDEAARRLIDRQVELAVRVVPQGAKDAGLPGDGQLHRKLLCRSQPVVVLSAGDELAKLERVSMGDLLTRELVVSGPGQPIREQLEAQASARGLPLRVAVEARGWPLTLQLCRLGVGVAVVNDVVRLPRGLVARPVEALPRVRYELLSWGPRREQRPAVGALMDELLAE